MIPELANIKTLRMKLGLTQSGFANQVGVSQSLIAKIEAGRIDPSFSKAKHIFEAMERLEKKNEAKAGEIMTKHILSVSPHEPIKQAIAKMKKANVSQLPVIEHHKSIGVVSESIILEALLSKSGSFVKDIMEDSPPVVSKNTSIQAVSNLLRYHPMVLVSDVGELKGVITKSDLLGKVFG